MKSNQLKKAALRTLWLSGAVGAALVAGAALSWAQQVPARASDKKDAKDEMLGKDSTQAVYVRESSTAVDKLVSAQKMERLKDWTKAAEDYQEVLEKYNDCVVPTGVDANNVINQYGNIKDKVREALSGWPKDGVDSYKAHYESQADAILNNADPEDLDALHKVFDTYFITDAGKRAGLQLMNLSLEAGEFESAARVGSELLKWHPGLGDDRAGIMFQTGLSAYYAGQTSKAQEMLQTLKTQLPAAHGTVRGADQVLADALAREMTAPMPAATEESADSWKVSIGGNPSRSEISTAKARPQARLYDIPLGPEATQPKADPNTFRNRNFGMQNASQESDLSPGVLPAVDHGELYFQDGRRMYAVSLDSGLPLPGWAQTYPGTGQFVLPNSSPIGQSRQLCVTLTDQSALAIMGEPGGNVQQMYMMQMQRPQNAAQTRLVCLSRQTGKPRWMSSTSDLPEAARALRGAELIGSPLVVGSNVLVLGRASSQVGFVDCYCLCFDLDTGKYRWNCYIASANTSPMMNFGIQGMGSQEGTEFTHPAYADGRVYVQTNVGAMAAIDAYNGSIAWLNLYPTNNAVVGNMQQMMMNMQRMQGQSAKPFAGNPLIVSKGKLFTIPSDSDDLLVYDVSTGAEVKRIDLKAFAAKGAEDGDLEKDVQSPLEFNTLVAVNGDEIILAGQHANVGQLVSFDWNKYTENDPALNWATAEIDSMMGRCFVTSDSVFVPMLKRLSRIDRASGSIEENYPPEDRVWDADAGEAPGNVLVTSDRVIVAGAKRIEVYADLSAAHKKLDAAVASAPTDPKPRLEYAEVMFVSGETDLAAKRLDEAMELLGGKSNLTPGTTRDRFFNDSMAFARKLSVLKNRQPEMVDRFFDRAAIGAGNPTQFVDYYLTRGAYAETLAHGDSAAANASAAVKLYQQVLSNPKFRDVQRSDDKGHGIDAGSLASAGIGRMIAVDPNSYGPYDAQAADALAKAVDAKSTGDVYRNIARIYPNSSSSPKALLASADAYESAGQSKDAIQVLRQVYFDRKNDQLAPELLESMARNYLKRPDHSTSDRLSAASASLSRAVAIAPDAMLRRPLPLPDGKTLQNQTLSQALSIVRQERGEESARLVPDFHLPIPPIDPTSSKGTWPAPFAPAGPADVIPDTQALLVPAREYARPDRVVTQNVAGQLCIYPAMQPDPLAKIDVDGDPLTGSAWSGNTLVAWGSNAIFSVKNGDAHPAWSLKLADLPQVQTNSDEGGDDQEGAQINELQGAVNVQGGNQVVVRQLVIRGNGRVLIRQGGIGGRQGGNESVRQVRPMGDRILCLSNGGRIVAIDAATGKLAWQARPGNGAGTSFVANEDFTVVRANENTGVRLCCYDTFSGRLLGEKSFPNNVPSPSNIALAADGTLVYAIGNRIAIKDLFKPWGDQPDKQSPPQPGQAVSSNMYNQQNGEIDSQLVISEGRILALWSENPYRGGAQGESVSVRVFSLDTAQPIAIHYSTGRGDGRLPVELDVGRNVMEVSLHAIGSRVYIVGGSTGISSYDLDHPGSGWEPLVGFFPHGTIVADALFGKDHVVLMTEPAGANPMFGMNPGFNPPPVMIRARGMGMINRNVRGGPVNASLPNMGIYGFARYPSAPGRDNESGRGDYSPAATPSCTISDPAGVDAVQGANGGICYLTGDHKLHLLRGAAQ